MTTSAAEKTPVLDDAPAVVADDEFGQVDTQPETSFKDSLLKFVEENPEFGPQEELEVLPEEIVVSPPAVPVEALGEPEPEEFD